MILILSLLFACAEDISEADTDTSTTTPGTTDTEPTNPTDTAAPTGSHTLPADDRVTATDLGGGVTEVVIDATREDGFVYYEPGNPDEVSYHGAWWFAFQRSESDIYPGIEVATLDGADFDALTTAPASGFVEDSAALATWYDYDPSTHVLSAADRVYVLTDGTTWYKVEFLDYYDDAGTSGYVSFRYASVGAP